MSDNKKYVLDVTNVNKSFGGLQALSSINLKIRQSDAAANISGCV